MGLKKKTINFIDKYTFIVIQRDIKTTRGILKKVKKVFYLTNPQEIVESKKLTQ